MKSGNETLIISADSDEYIQACAVSANYKFAEKEEIKLVFEARQLYGTEAEDYFFYFIGSNSVTISN
jgi:hypothetical protein